MWEKSAFLISAGTAIYGGSAIAAVAPIADANEEEMAVSLGTVFVLNSVGPIPVPVFLGYLFSYDPGTVRPLVCACNP